MDLNNVMHAHCLNEFLLSMHVTYGKGEIKKRENNYVGVISPE